MQKNTPVTNDPISSDGILGDNLEALILHKAYLELVKDKEEKEGKNDDKN